MSLLAPYRTAVAGIAAVSAAEVLLRVLVPWPLAAVVDYLASNSRSVAATGAASSPSGQLLALVAVGLLLLLAHEVVLLVHTRMQAVVGQRMVFDLRAGLFTHLQFLPLAHHEQTSPADAVSRIERDAACVEHLVLRTLLPVASSTLTLLALASVLAWLDPLLALASVAMWPVLFVALRQQATIGRPHADRARALEAATIGRLAGALGSIRLVKAFAREEHELERFRSAASDAMREQVQAVRHGSLVTLSVGATLAVGAALVLAVGGLHVLGGTLTTGRLLVAFVYLGFMYGPLSTIAAAASSLPDTLASAQRVHELFALSREDRDDDVAITPARFRGAVRFEDVSFAYGPGQPVLNHVSLDVHPGETIALVGRSAAGKATLVGLLGRFHEPASGRVLIDGTDVRRFKVRALRDQIATVSPDPVVVHGSLGENILYGRLDATEHEVMLAARAAQCEEVLSGAPDPLDIPLGNGHVVSGGQRQRISLARAFLKDAPILVLDEPELPLDKVAEEAMQRALTELRHGRTTFVIAHRLSSVRDADRILVLDEGTVVAQGTHDALLRGSPLYRDLVAGLLDGVDPPDDLPTPRYH